MTIPCVATGAESAALASYEELRRHVLAGAGFGSHFGLVLLLREGVAAWIRGALGSSVPVQREASSDRRSAPRPVPDEIHAGIVRVLANMALSGRQEMIS